MKKLILTLFLFVGVNSFSQTISDVVSVDTILSKTNLYSNALSFFALEFKSANDVIQMKDAETGKVIGKGIIDGRSITIGISCKNGKYKYDIDIAPCKNDIDIVFNTTKVGMNKGKTIGKLKWINEQLTIPAECILFYPIDMLTKSFTEAKWVLKYNSAPYCDEMSLKNKTVYYNIPLAKKATEEWHMAIEEEIKQKLKEYIDMANPNEERNKIIISNLIGDLKREMTKKSDW